MPNRLEVVLPGEMTPAAESFLSGLRRTGERHGVELDLRTADDILVHGATSYRRPWVPYIWPRLIVRPYARPVDHLLWPAVDVEGMGNIQLGRLMAGTPDIVPPVCQAVHEWTLIELGEEVGGHHVTVIGTGMGAMVARYLSLKGADVDLLHTGAPLPLASRPLVVNMGSEPLDRSMRGDGVLDVTGNDGHIGRRTTEILMQRVLRWGEEDEPDV